VEKICSSRVDFWMIRLTRSFEGKTTVARLYAKFLMSIEIVPGKNFIETTATEVIHVKDIEGTALDLREIRDDRGGVRLSTFGF
jgi:hypothetical protein